VNAPRNDKDLFLYPYAIVTIVMIKPTTQGYRNLAHLARKRKGSNINQCMNALLS